MEMAVVIRKSNIINNLATQRKKKARQKRRASEIFMQWISCRHYPVYQTV
jgi:hypothetical protein